MAGEGEWHVEGGEEDLRRVWKAQSIDWMAVCHTGALVGPPWSKRENGFVLAETQTNGLKMYYEPHCDYDESSVASVGKVDAIVTPVNSQVLIKFPLVGLPGLKGKVNVLWGHAYGAVKPLVLWCYAIPGHETS